MLRVYLISGTDCEELVASLDPNCELVDLESQVSAARETEASLSAIDWDDIIKQKNAVLGLVAHPLLQVAFILPHSPCLQSTK